MSLLTRYILGELLKVMLLSCAVLVTVIAFGAAIKPIAQNLLGPLDLAKYIGLATVPMLQFALPFSAGLAATIVLHRMAADNEIQAMSTSGVSYRRVLRPVLIAGAGLMLAMLVLVNFVVPRFWVMVQATLTRDVTRLFVSTIRDGHAFRIGDLQIYADEVMQAPPTASGAGGAAAASDSGPEPPTRLLLAGVAAVQFDDDQRPTTEFTAEFATVDVYRTADAAYLKPLLTNATVFREDEGALVVLPRAEPDAAKVSPQRYQEPKFMTLGQIVENVREPDRYEPISRRRDQLRNILYEAAAWRHAEDLLAAGDAPILESPSARRSYELRNVTIDGDRLQPADGDLFTVVERIGGGQTRAASAAKGLLAPSVVAGPGGAPVVSPDGEAPEIVWSLALVDPEVEGADGAEAGGRWPARIDGLSLAGFDGARAVSATRLPPTPPLGADGAERRAFAADLSARIDAARGPASLRDRARLWTTGTLGEIDRLGRDVVARLSQRVALSVSAALLLLVGAVLAIWRRESVPLEIYVLAFVPSIANILLIASGEQMVRAGRFLAGSATMWSGNAVMVAVLALAWSRMARH
ncbi:MAG: LptF/LptG family permease [Phycisphaerales bacterium]